MGSGFNFFTNAVDVTPTTTGAWVDIDVSAYIPSGATGVILDIHNTGTVLQADVRKNGSTDDDYAYGRVFLNRHLYFIVGVDENRVFEAKIGGTTIKIYLKGYTDANVVLFTNKVDKSTTTTGAYVDTDVSANVSADATGVILKIININASTAKKFAVRKNGSTDDRYYLIWQGSSMGVAIGVDADKIFEQKIEATDVKVYLAGYTKPPITFFTNAIDKSITTTGAWTDIDLTADTEASADGAIFQIVNTDTATGYAGEFRKNGSTDTFTGQIGLTGHIWAFVGLDAENICEGYIGNVAVDFYLIGYCKPAAVTVTWAAAVKTTHVYGRPLRKMTLTQNLNTGHIFSRPFRSFKLSQALNLTHVFLRHRLMKFSQALQILHTWTVIYPALILKQWLATLNVTHTFKRPYRQMHFTQMLQTIHALTFKRFFKLTQALSMAHVLRRPIRRIGYTQQLQPIHVFSRPVRVIRFPATLQLTHVFGRPFRLLKLLEQLGLVHAYYVAKPEVKAARLIMQLGPVAVDLSTGEVMLIF